MARENKTEFAILGILTQYECSGYDMRKFIENSLGYFWNESFGQIYPNLKKMQLTGLIRKKREIEAKGPARVIYSITPKGSLKLRQWLSASAEPFVERNELLLKLFFGSQSTLPQIKSHLAESRQRNQNLLNTFSEIEKNIEQYKNISRDWPFWQITLEYGKMKSRMELQWIEKSLEILHEFRGKMQTEDNK